MKYFMLIYMIFNQILLWVETCYDISRKMNKEKNIFFLILQTAKKSSRTVLLWGASGSCGLSVLDPVSSYLYHDDSAVTSKELHRGLHIPDVNAG